MQQGLTTTPIEEFRARRAQRPGLLKRPQLLFVLALMAVDIASVWLGFLFAYQVIQNDPSTLIGPFYEFWPLPAFASGLLLLSFFTQRMYQRRRPIAHLDESYRIATLTTLSFLLAIAVTSLLWREFTYHRMFVGLAWLFAVGMLTVGRLIHARVQWRAQAQGVGDDRVLLVGAGEVGRAGRWRGREKTECGLHVAPATLIR